MAHATIVDNTVLSNFAQVQRPDLLNQAFPEIAAPDAVFQELKRGEELGRIPKCDWSALGWVTLTPEERQDANVLQEKLGPGESECIAVAAARNMVLLTDDWAARNVAQALNIAISGTLGTLTSLTELDVLTFPQAEQLHSAMVASGYRSPVNSLSEL